MLVARFTLSEVATILGISKYAARRLVDTDKLPAEKHPRTGVWLVSSDDLEEYQHRQTARVVKCSQCGLETTRDDGVCATCHEIARKAAKRREQTRQRRIKRATHVTVSSEALALKPVATERQEEIALLAVLQSAAVAQLSENPQIDIEAIGEWIEYLGLLRGGETIKGFLARIEGLDWLKINWVDSSMMTSDLSEIVEARIKESLQEEDYMTIAQTAERLGISRTWISDRARAGKIPGARRKKLHNLRSPWIIPADWDPEGENGETNQRELVWDGSDGSAGERLDTD